jgi:ADP-heptose:LPS heptosyltransferase
MFPGALGDFICFLPALQFLARQGGIDLLARSEFAEIAPPGVKIRASEGHAFHRLFAEDRSDDTRLREFFAPYQKIYSWTGGGQETFVRNLQSVAQGEVKIFPFRPAEAKLHQADYYIRCLDRGATVPVYPRIELSAEAWGWSDEFWRRHGLQGKAVLAIAPGSGAREKNWPEENFLAVAQWWRRTTGGEALALVGPVEEERGGAERLAKSCRMARGLTLEQAGALLRRSDLFLGNDSGISHLAGAVGAYSVVLFGPSDPRQWAPRGKRVAVLQRNTACSPCAAETMKSCPHHACLTEFSPRDVIGRIADLPPAVTLTRVEAGIKV